MTVERATFSGSQHAADASTGRPRPTDDIATSSLLKRVHFLQQDNMSIKSSSSSSAPVGHSTRVPLLMFPHELTFIADDPASHKQVVTIYNPYNIHLKYRALCTAPQKYSMPNWNGNITPQHRVDIVIRMTEITDANIGVIEKFRFCIYDLAAPVETLLGEREVPAVLVATEEALKCDSSRSRGMEHSFRYGSSRRLKSTESTTVLERTEQQRPEGAEPGPSLFVILLALLCIVALSMPNSRTEVTEEEDTSWIASYVTLSVNQKLIAAYVLGLVTMAIFRPH